MILVEDTETISHDSHPPGELVDVGFMQHLTCLPFIQLHGMNSAPDMIDTYVACQRTNLLPILERRDKRNILIYFAIS